MADTRADPGNPLSRRHLQHVGLVAVGNFASAALGLALLLLLARALPPAGLTLVVSMIAIIDGGQLFLDATFNAGIVSVAARRGEGEVPDAAILRAGLWAKAAGGVALAALIAALAAPMSQGLVGDRSLVLPIVLAGGAAGLAGMQTFVLAVLQTRGAFGRIAFATLWKNLIRIAVVTPFLLVDEPDARAAAIAICAGTAVTLAISLPLIRWDFLRDRAPMREGLAALHSVNGWMVLVAVATLGGRLDVWLVGLLGGAHQAGLYALAAQLCVGVGVITQALVTTFLPSVSRLRGDAEINAFIRRWSLCVPLAVAAVGLAWPLSGPLIGTVFGADYAGSAPVFIVLFAASLMTLVGAPLMLLLLTLGEARIFALGSVVQFALRVALAVPVIPRAGALGLAIADIASRIIAMILIGYFIWAALRRGRGRQPHDPPYSTEEKQGA